MTSMRNAAEEAAAALGGSMVGRVLEPSPPAIEDGAFFADDPVHAVLPDDVDRSMVVSPFGPGKTWRSIVNERPDLQAWAEARWLTSTRRLPEIPKDYVDQRTRLHRLATYAIAPARHQTNGKFGLRWTKGGFGTPFFGNDRQVRIEGNLLVVQEATYVKSTPISSIAAAAEFIGSKLDDKIAAEHDSPALGDINTDLEINSETVDFLDAWWGMATAALEQVRADAESTDPSRVQLWPGHFDPAVEIGDVDRRSSYGASPGDQTSDEPYLYLSIWWPERLDLTASNDFWNADGFVGARMPYSFIKSQADPMSTAVDFFRGGRDRLAQSQNALT